MNNKVLRNTDNINNKVLITSNKIKQMKDPEQLQRNEQRR